MKTERSDGGFRPCTHINKAVPHTHCKNWYLLNHTQKSTQDQCISISTASFKLTSAPPRATCKALSALQHLTQVSSPGNTGKWSRFPPSTNHCLFTAMSKSVSRLTLGLLGAEAKLDDKVKQNTTLLYQTFTPGFLVAWDFGPLNRSPRLQAKQDNKEGRKKKSPQN